MEEEGHINIFLNLCGLKNLIRNIEELNIEIEKCVSESKRTGEYPGPFVKKMGDVVLEHNDEDTYWLKIPVLPDDEEETYVDFPRMNLILACGAGSPNLGLEGFDVYKTLTKEELQGLCRKYLESEGMI